VRVDTYVRTPSQVDGQIATKVSLRDRDMDEVVDNWVVEIVMQTTSGSEFLLYNESIPVEIRRLGVIEVVLNASSTTCPTEEAVSQYSILSTVYDVYGCQVATDQYSISSK